ncbi:stage V sporulation protein E [Actinomycetes bacterium]|nr:stage V sporulation protein E [Actinomycetes bacterium]
MTTTQALPRPRSMSERRIHTLQKSGTAAKRKLSQNAPTTTYYGILIIVTFLTLLGIVMVLSSSAVTSFQVGNSPWSLFRRQLLWAVFGSIAMAFTYRTPYNDYRRSVKWLLGGAFLLNLLPLFPGIGKEVNGARAWVNAGDFSFQPSELSKIVVVLFCADLIARRHRYLNVFKKTLMPCLLVMSVGAGLSGLQSDFGSALVFVGIVLMICFFAGMPRKWVGSITAVSAIVGLLIFATQEVARNRLTAFLNPSETKGRLGYQVHQSLLGIANGGTTGAGIGQGSTKWGYLPLAHSDFIFTVVAEELGAIGSITVIGLFMFLVILGMRVALGAREMFGSLLAAGIAGWFAFQSIINIGGATGSLPLTGLTLPFMSSGGSSLMVSMAAAGVLLNVARNMK